MPALFTHYDFGKKVYNSLDNNIKDSIDIKYYNVFIQGFDNLFYSLYKWNYYRKFATSCQLNDSYLFFSNIIDYINNNNLQNNHSANSIIYGFIIHYILDTIIHPLINYQAKNLNSSHAKLEFMLDYEVFNNKKLFSIAIPRLKFSKTIINMLNYSFITTYNKKNIGYLFNMSHNNNYYVYKYIIYDKHNIKTKILNIIDKIINNKNIKLSHYTINSSNYNRDFYNFNNYKWINPVDKKEYYYSYNELYDYALKTAKEAVTMTYKVLHNRGNKDNLIDYIKCINISNM